MPAGPRHHHLCPRSRTCPWLTSPLPRRPSLWLAPSLQTPLLPRSQAARQPQPLPRVSCRAAPSPHQPRRPHQPHQLHQPHQPHQPHLQPVLFLGLQPSSPERNRWAAVAKAVVPLGRMWAHPWSRPRCCRWYGYAPWVRPLGPPPQRHRRHNHRGWQPPRSPCGGPCLDGPALHLLLQGCMLLCDSRRPAWLPPTACWVPSLVAHLRQNPGLPNLLPPLPASSSPRAPRSCSWSGPCLPRPRLTCSGKW